MLVQPLNQMSTVCITSTPSIFQKGVIMTIMRDGEYYEVIDECGDEIAVNAVFQFANYPYTRELKLWWEKKYCTVIKQ